MVIYNAQFKVGYVRGLQKLAIHMLLAFDVTYSVTICTTYCQRHKDAPTLFFHVDFYINRPARLLSA